MAVSATGSLLCRSLSGGVGGSEWGEWGGTCFSWAVVLGAPGGLAPRRTPSHLLPTCATRRPVLLHSLWPALYYILRPVLYHSLWVARRPVLYTSLWPGGLSCTTICRPAYCWTVWRPWLVHHPVPAA